MYFDGGDAAVNKSKHFEPFESVEDVHGPEILQDELDDFNFILFFPDVVLEAVHSFLSEGGVTMMSMRELSVFLTFYFYFSGGVGYILSNN